MGVLMREPFLGLVFCYFLRLSNGRLHFNCGDLTRRRIYPNVGKVFTWRLRNVDRPDQHPVLFFKLNALDCATLDSSQCNSFSLMLSDARLFKQLRFTSLCP